MKITLSFDNGPDLDTTPLVLDTLGAEDVKATFFLLGRNLRDPAKRGLARRAVEEGHRLGNHTYSHGTPFGLREEPEEAVAEILATESLLGPMAGAQRLFRPNGRGRIGSHLLNRAAWDFLVERQYTCVLWSQMAPERDQPDTWMEPTVQACRQQAWTLMVLHDLPSGAMRKLGVFIRMLREEGAQFTQEYPDHSVPLRNGRPNGPYEHLMPGER